jgi:DNA polymerase I-like protein with 3'-5' exonuclease and polymerase domains
MAIETPRLWHPNDRYFYARTKTDVREWCRAFYDAPDRKRVAFDIETTGLDPRTAQVVLMQLKILSLPALIVDCTMFSLANLDTPLNTFWHIFESHDFSKIIHNSKFEYAFMLQHFGVRIARMYDSMLAEQLLTAGLNVRSGLKDVVFRRLGIEMDKTLQTSFGVSPMQVMHDAYATEPLQERAGDFSLEQLAYAVADVEVLFPIMKEQVVELRAHSMLEVAQLEFDLVPALAEAELHGVQIDRERWHNHVVSLDHERALLEEDLVEVLTPYVEKYREAKYGEQAYWYSNQLADYEALHALREAQAQEHKQNLIDEGTPRGEAQRSLNAWKKDNPPPKKPPAPACGEGPINLRSYDQLQGALDVLGVDLPRSSNGGLETGRKELQALATEWPIVEQLLQWREYQKLVSAFGENILDMLDEGDRLHPDFNQLVSTGRLSCRRPNIQQIPGADKELGKEFRRSFIAPPRRKLVAADYSQIELRILAEVTQERSLIEAFNTGVDLHSLTASVVFGLPLEDIKEKYPDKRKASKTLNFGIMYGRGPMGIAQELGISLGEAKQYLETYLANYPGVSSWKKKVQEQGLKDLFSSTLLGRKRFFPPLPDISTRTRNDPMWEGHVFQKGTAQDQAEYKRVRAGYERMLANAVIQGTSADITKQAMVSIYRAIGEMGLDAFLVMSVHDELVLECAEEIAGEVVELVKEQMVLAGERFLTSVPVEVEAKAADFWEH